MDAAATSRLDGLRSSRFDASTAIVVALLLGAAIFLVVGSPPEHELRAS